MYLSEPARSRKKQSSTDCLSFIQQFNTLRLCARHCPGEVNPGNKATKANVPAFVKFPSLWEETNKEGGNQYTELFQENQMM